ncbi:MAG: aminotransferase class I/II-fold pyridoxal phosphate-dependent enzyme [Bacteroidota bacterium]
MNFETLAIRHQLERTQYREHSVPLFNTSSFVFDDAEQMRALFADEVEGDIYSRYSNPNSNEFENKIKALEGTEDAFATASGMAAVFAGFAALLKAGDHVIASKALFGASFQILTNILPGWGIDYSLADPTDLESWHELVRPNTKLIYIETPSNPGLEIIDLEWVGQFAAIHNLILNVDNCFATPYLQQPGKFGAHLVTHSATKYIDGQGRVLGGIITGNAELINEIRSFCRRTGPALAPFNAWILSKSLETLAVRLDRHCANALEIAKWLEVQGTVLKVKYPFLASHPQVEIAKKQMKAGGGIITFELEGGLERGSTFLNSLQLISRSANLGDTRTIATHPASTTHAKLSEEDRLSVGITDNLVRISVGLEHPDDIKADLERAFSQSQNMVMQFPIISGNGI